MQQQRGKCCWPAYTVHHCSRMHVMPSHFALMTWPCHAVLAAVALGSSIAKCLQMSALPLWLCHAVLPAVASRSFLDVVARQVFAVVSAAAVALPRGWEMQARNLFRLSCGLAVFTLLHFFLPHRKSVAAVLADLKPFLTVD